MMIKKLLFTYSLLVFIFSFSYTQSITLQFFLWDKTHDTPIQNAHVFIINSTYGTVSQTNGQVVLQIPKNLKEDLLITHLNYETKLLSPPQYQAIQKQDTIWLEAHNFEVDEIIISAKRTNKWKKNYKKFKTAFLGLGKAATKTKILNPEVLRFKEEKGILRTTAIDLLQIQNDFLAYHIQYLLTELNIEADGSVNYLGQANFKDISTDKNRNKILQNRADTYKNSPKHFFASLLNNNLKTDGYELELLAYKNQKFIPLLKPSPDMLLKKTADSSIYRVQFNEFLKVVNKNTKSVVYSKFGVRSGGLESQRFSLSQVEDKAKVQFATSYLYKIVPFILIDKFGNVLNSKVVKEYGFWATQKVALQLPFNYGNVYDLKSQKENNEAIIIHKQLSKLSDSQKLNAFKTLIYEQNETFKKQILTKLDEYWEQEYIPILIEILRMSRDAWLLEQIDTLLIKKTKQDFRGDYYEWLQWLWKKPPMYGTYYADFKAELYKNIDPKFEQYFKNRQKETSIRLDEIVWGGVHQDGIPPLHQPSMIAAKDATYLKNNHIVFGLYLNGQAKAYPKRILAWHEFFTDTFGDIEIAGVYCTLCGTVIAYDRKYQQDIHDLGTSGFLYRSNKLMYDKATQSLWNTIEGKPVLGTLNQKNITLKSYPLVTSTWGAWKKRHPDTKVLSPDTGFERDYEEAIAYQDYFATDALMFPVPKLDQRLPNKAAVLIIRAKNYKKDPLAISIEFLKKKKWYLSQIADTKILVITNKQGATRAYNIKNIVFENYKKGLLKDNTGAIWQIKEDYLENKEGQKLQRLPSHNIFWFAWYNMYPNTRLVF